jgi:hypothetical protein
LVSHRGPQRLQDPTGGFLISTFGVLLLLFATLHLHHATGRAARDSWGGSCW